MGLSQRNSSHFKVQQHNRIFTRKEAPGKISKQTNVESQKRRILSAHQRVFKRQTGIKGGKYEV